MAKSMCDGVHFKPATGGLMSTTTMKTKRSGQGGGGSHDYEDTSTIHPTMEHAMTHLKKHLGHVFGAETEAEGEKG